MRKYLFLFTFLLLSAKSFAQDKDFNYKFYGQIRTDFYYNSRANEETVDGLFYMYPKDKVYDATGKDLNATANGSFYTLYTRLGMDDCISWHVWMVAHHESYNRFVLPDRMFPALHSVHLLGWHGC